eukprot:g3292.t1
MPFGFGGACSDETKLKAESNGTQRPGKEHDNPTDDDKEEEARLGRDFPRSSAAVGAATRPKILLCLSGSVAVVKAPQLAVKLAEFAEIKILVTEASKHFLERSKAYNSEAYAAFSALDPPIRVLADADEWGAWDAVGDSVLHIQLRDWADMLLVAPLSTNTLAKLANGLCDNLVTCVARAWDFRNKKNFVVAPSMNTHMWDHPLTERCRGSCRGGGYIRSGEATPGNWAAKMTATENSRLS